MRFTILLLIVIVIFVLISGCTIHFKGENIELDAERQRVYKFESFGWTAAQLSHPIDEVTLYCIDYIGFYDHKL